MGNLKNDERANWFANNTGGRLKRLEKYLKNETFMLTYGDGLSNVNLKKL